MQSSTSQLNLASKDLRELVASIKSGDSQSPELQERLDELNEQLLGFDNLLKTTSTNTAKVAVLSKALEKDYQRLKEFSDGSIEGVPNLVLPKHEALRLCDAQLAFSVHEMETKAHGKNQGHGSS